MSLYVYVSIPMLFIFDSRLFMSMSTSMSLYVYVYIYVSILMLFIYDSCLFMSTSMFLFQCCLSTILVFMSLVSLCLCLCLYSNVVYIRFLSARVSGNTLRTFQDEKKEKHIFLETNQSFRKIGYLFLLYRSEYHRMLKKLYFYSRKVHLGITAAKTCRTTM